MVPLVDSHCHLDVAEFDADRTAVLARARAAGVTMQVIPAISRAAWQGLRGLCAEEPGLYAAYGMHPMFMAEHREEDIDALADWLRESPAVAVGECGLDYYIDDPQPQAQQHLFEAQLAIAREFDLPLILHARRALDPVIAALRRVGGLRGVVHSFGGSAEQAAQLWRLGFRLGIGGPVTYARARRLRGVVASIPVGQLLLETDAPDQPLAAHRGQRNEPCRLPEVLAEVAALRETTPEALAEQVWRNAQDLFALPDPEP
jgi:TatD DNase family protein